MTSVKQCETFFKEAMTDGRLSQLKLGGPMSRLGVVVGAITMVEGAMVRVP